MSQEALAIYKQETMDDGRVVYVPVKVRDEDGYRLPIEGTIEATVDTTGLATSAKQPALGTAGSPSTDVITVQGRSGMTAVAVDGSAVTQPVSIASQPLPTGAATEATLSSLASDINDIATSTSDVAVITSGSEIKYVDVTLSLDTSAYGSGDLIADAQVVAACVRANDVPGVLHSLVVVDEDDQKAAIDIYLTNVSTSWGTENSAPTITDAAARSILGVVSVAASDYKDLGGVSIAFKGNVGMTVLPATGTDDVYVAVVSNASTPTYTASGVRLRLGFL